MSGHHFSPETVGKVIETYYRVGASCENTSRFLTNNRSIRETSVAPQTVCSWVRTYSEVAVTAMEGRKASAGASWDLFAVLLAAPQIWWVAVDQDSGYILCSHLGDGTARDGAREAVHRAKLSSARRCTGVAFHAVRPSRRWELQDLHEQAVFKGIRSALPKVSLSLLCPWADVNYGRFRGQWFLRELEKTGRRFNRVKNSERLAIYLGGWVVSRNLFNSMGMAEASSPGELAQVGSPFSCWSDVVRYSASKSHGFGRQRLVLQRRV